MNVLLIMGHPRPDSLCGALADAYRDGALEAGAIVRTLVLADLEFDVHVRVDSPEHQPLEPDLQRAARLLEWADHVVFVYPTWWGTMPALLKGFLDRMVMPGVAFRFRSPRATDWVGLWRGKSAQLITTMDTPPPIYRLFYRSPGTHAMRNATLGFCGVKPVRVLTCGSVRTSTPRQRRIWLEKARRAGWSLHRGIHAPGWKLLRHAGTWLRALRLQFYPMTCAAYTLGALIAPGHLAAAPYAWGYLYLFLLEAATVFCNDYFDVGTDRLNINAGFFTGGSRVLLDGRMNHATLRHGIVAALVLAAGAGAMAVRASPQPGATASWLLLAVVVTLGYTVPPLKLCYRGLGELDVAFTHSALVLMAGYLLQGGSPHAGGPWLLALPLALAILPSITLAGVPDRDADAAVGKITLAVLLGIRGALATAGLAVAASAMLAAAFDRAGTAHGAFRGISYFVLPHAALCLFLLYRQADRPPDRRGGRIDGLLFATLNYMIWFVAVPIYHMA